jgi:hypothetical protein
MDAEPAGDSALTLSFKCIHNGKSFNVDIPSSKIRISALRCDIAQYLMVFNLPFDQQSYRIVYNGRTLLDNDSLDTVLLSSSGSTTIIFFLVFNDSLFAEQDREGYLLIRNHWRQQKHG